MTTNLFLKLQSAFWQFQTITVRVSVREHCFPIRVIVLCNRLPVSVVLTENIQMFKKLIGLKHVDFSYAVFGKA